ncbi:MAG: hypothetical protein WBB23_11335 [Desulforhopalus sp.]
MMDNQTIISKSLGLNKTAFTNTLAIFSTMQQQGESLFKTTLEQSPWLPGSSKDACLYWFDFYSKYLNSLQSMADQSFEEMERISLPLLKLVEEASPQAIATEKSSTPLPAKKRPAVRDKKVSAKETSVAKTLPEKKSVSQNVPAEKPTPRNASAAKPAPKNASAEKPAPKNASAEKPASKDASAEKPASRNASAEKPAPQDASAEKPAPQDANVEKTVIQDKPDVNKSNK